MSSVSLIARKLSFLREHMAHTYKDGFALSASRNVGIRNYYSLGELLIQYLHTHTHTQDSELFIV